MASRRKRGQGEGGIRKRADGRFESAVSLGWRGGKRFRKYYYGYTRAEVQEKLNQALELKRRAMPIVIEKQTVGQFLARWLEESVRPSVEPSTFIQYAQHVRLYIAPQDRAGRFLPLPALGAIRLAKLTPQHVQSFVSAQLKSGRSKRTAQLSLVILRRALGQAVKWDLAARNVAKLVDAPKVERPPVNPLTPERARQFLESSKGDRFEAIYAVALGCGMREGEILGLRWEDVDLEARTLRVSHTLQRIDSKLTLKAPKTKQSRRAINLPALVLNALKAQHARQLELKMANRHVWQETGLVFTTRVGSPIDAGNLCRQFKRALRKAGLPSIRFHDLRHSAASLLLARGMHPRAIMELLGHSRIGLTMDTYSHVMPAMMREVADNMDAALS